MKKLQERKHICGMTGDGVNDAPALKKADIGIAVADATDAARSASDIVLTEPGLSVIISAVLTSRAIFQRMKNYTVSIYYGSKIGCLGFRLIIWPLILCCIALIVDICCLHHHPYCCKLFIDPKDASFFFFANFLSLSSYYCFKQQEFL